MNARDLFLQRYNGLLEYPVYLLKGMTNEHIGYVPDDRLNSIAWILWHISRCEDLAVNSLILEGDQILDDLWCERLGISDITMGTGMPKPEADRLGRTVDVTSLVAYRAEVTLKTESFVNEYPSDRWSETLEKGILESKLVTHGYGGPQAEEIVKHYAGQSKGWLLGHLALTHTFYHIGQAFTVRRLLDYPNPW